MLGSMLPDPVPVAIHQRLLTNPRCILLIRITTLHGKAPCHHANNCIVYVVGNIRETSNKLRNDQPRVPFSGIQILIEPDQSPAIVVDPEIRSFEKRNAILNDRNNWRRDGPPR
jgi:hypothetical protein